MADRYWVGGAGTWDTTTTTNWATASGGAGGASAPTAADNVFFDVNSNIGTGIFTVTLAAAVCNDFTASGLDGAMTLAFGTSTLTVSGSWVNPATNFVVTSTSGTLTFNSTATGKTFTTNGVSFAPKIVFNGVGGGWTLGSALTATSSSLSITITAGSFSTSGSNYSVTCPEFVSTGTGVRAISFNASTITLSSFGTALNFQDPTNLTYNAGTSTIVVSSASNNVNGGGLTYYNFTYSGTLAGIGTKSITGANTFNNLTFTSSSGTGVSVISFSANQTVSGTLTLGAANTVIRRTQVQSSIAGTQRTITLNGTLATLADVDFRDIVAAGTAGTWAGTRIGDGTNNSGITFDAPKTVYWNLAGTQNWSATGWATTNNGAPSANNFPLAQDTATFTEAGAAGTVTMDSGWWVGNLQMADGVSNRTTAFTLSTANGPQIYGNMTLFSNLIINSVVSISFNASNKTQTVTSAGIIFPQSIVVQGASKTFKLADNFTQTSTSGFGLTSGTVDLNNKTLTCYSWVFNNSNTRSILFGSSGQITVTGNAATIWSGSTLTNFSFTGTSNVVLNYSGATGTRTIAHGNAAGGSESLAVSFAITAGTDIVTTSGTGHFKNLIFTGFSGTLSTAARNIYGNLTFSSGMTVAAGANTQSFLATSGNQQITSNGQTLELNININGVGTTVVPQDTLTLGATRNLSLSNGTLNLNGLTTTCNAFTVNAGTKNITFNGGTLAVSGSGVSAFSNNVPTGFTTTGAGTISMTSASAKYFVGGGATYTCTLNQGGAGALTITGNNTFANLTATTVPSTILFTSGATNTFATFTLSGTAGNLVTLGATSTTQTTLTKPSAWNVGANSVDGGNNTGLSFTAGTSNYLSISYINGVNSQSVPISVLTSFVGFGFGFKI